MLAPKRALVPRGRYSQRAESRTRGDVVATPSSLASGAHVSPETGVPSRRNTHRVDSSYVGRHLNLTLLVPDIVEAILMGRGPDRLTLEKLYRLPVGWEEQGKVVKVE